ncbi:hypothetical protein GCM10027416_03540 [Okibacterium endophyticum]
MTSAFLDSTVFLYALGTEHPLKQASVAVIEQGAAQGLRFYCNVEVIQEVAFHRLRRTSDRTRAVAEARLAMSTCTVLPFDREILDASLDLLARMPTIRGRDAVHAASALAYGIETIITPDTAFDGIPGLTRAGVEEFAASFASPHEP